MASNEKTWEMWAFPLFLFTTEVTGAHSNWELHCIGAVCQIWLIIPLNRVSTAS